MGLFSSWFGRSDADHGRVREVVAAGATVLDVRTPDEYAQGHVAGAVNIPVQVLAGRLSEVPKGRPIVVYCRSGGRSASAAALLRQSGWTEVYDVGPMSAFPA